MHPSDLVRAVANAERRFGPRRGGPNVVDRCLDTTGILATKLHAILDRGTRQREWRGGLRNEEATMRVRMVVAAAAVAVLALRLDGVRDARTGAQPVFSAGSPVWPSGFVSAWPGSHGDAEFVTMASGAVVAIRRDGASVSLPTATFDVSYLATRGAVSMSPGADSGARMSAFVGRDPSGWRRNATVYESVRCRGLYPGIDLEYSHTAAGSLKSTWYLRPGSNPDNIRWSYSDDVTVRLIGGDLWIDDHVAAVRASGGRGGWRELAPVAWQVLPHGRREVRARYRQLSDRSFGFALTSHDPGYPLVIDPTFVWSTFLGGSSSDGDPQLAIGADGGVYFATHTSSPDFPAAAALFAPGQSGRSSGDVVVGKVAADGSRVVWSTLVGGTGRDFGLAIALDHEGNIFVTGMTDSSDFPLVDAVQSEFRGKMDVFVIELNRTGQALLWSTYLGGAEHDEGQAVAVHGDGVIVIGGRTQSGDFPVVRSTQSILKGTADGFVAWFGPDHDLLNSTFLGGSGSDAVWDICLDTSDNAYLVGGAGSDDFPVVNGRLRGRGGFLCRASTAGAFDYCTLLGATAYDCAVATRGRVVVVGSASTDIPLVKSLQEPRVGSPDASIMVVDGDRQTILFSSPLGGGKMDLAFGVDVDDVGDAYVLGYTRSPDFPTVDPLDASLSGFDDGFVARIDLDAPALLGSTYLGGTGVESMGPNYHGSIAVTERGVALAAGSTASVDFPTTRGVMNRSFGPPGDGWLAMIDFRRDPPPPTATPDPGMAASVCPQILHRVPPAAIAVAMADPGAVSGWGMLCRPELPPGPWNGERRMLTLSNLSAPYHPLHNSLVFGCGCP